MKNIDEKNTPSNKKLYNRIKARIKKKFKVWPSAYASAALVKAYKSAGGGYRKTNEMLEVVGYTTDQYDNILDVYFGVNNSINESVIHEAEYRGRKVKLGKPFRTPGGPKKFAVYVKNPNGNVVKVNFGHKGQGGQKTMRIKKSNPERRAAFRARHNCDTPGPRHKARYWSCRFGWPRSGKGAIDKT